MRIFSFSLLICLTLSAASTNSALNEFYIAYSKVDIVCEGKFRDKEDRSMGTTSHPFTASLVDNSLLTITSEARVPNITASIIKDGVTIEQTFFSIGKDETETIYLYDFEPGEYVLLLTTPLGTHLEGLFHL